MTGFSVFGKILKVKPKHKFQLKYAPHLGMFRESAGDDPIAQLNFMADEGFTAFEDELALTVFNLIHFLQSSCAVSLR